MKSRSVMVALLLGMGASYTLAQANYSQPQPFMSKERVSEVSVSRAAAPEFKVVFSEDFSKFVAGSETAIDPTDIGGPEPDYVISPQYLNSPGWYGLGIHQAGGACALTEYEFTYPDWPDYVYKNPGYISTPHAELFGDVEVTFRAKKLAGPANTLWVGLCDDTSGSLESKEYALTDQWQNFTFKSNKGTFNNQNIVQFNGLGGTHVLIDDIVVKRAITRTEAPVADNPINNSFEEFVARWFPAKRAQKYILNVFRKVDAAQPVKGTIKENFDGLNVVSGNKVDVANPNYPKGWNIEVSKNGKEDVNTKAGFYNSAPRSLVLDAVGDIIETPELPANIKEVRFWVRPSSYVNEAMPSMISVSVWDSVQGKWMTIANMPNYFFKEYGGMHRFNSEQVGMNATKIKIEYLVQGSNAVTFNIDDFEIDYETQMVDEPVLVNYETTDTFHVVKGIDPSREHYYYVQAVEGNLVSDKTKLIWVNSIEGLKPVVGPSSNVTKTGFDVEWTKFYNASEYKADLYKIVKASGADLVGAVVVDEDFASVKQGTVSRPMTDYGVSLDFADKGLVGNRWTATCAQWASGMIGTRGSNPYTQTPGFIASPAIALDANKGAFEVDFTVYTSVPDESVYIMVMPSLTENSVQTRMVSFKGQVGSYSGTAKFEVGGIKHCHVAIMSTNGNGLFLDKMVVRQDLKAGESCYVPYRAETVWSNKHSYYNLPEGSDYSLMVQAKRTKLFVDYISKWSDRFDVNMTMGGVETEALAAVKAFGVEGGIRIAGVEGKEDVCIYNLQGQMVGKSVADGSLFVEMPRGAYLVKVGNAVSKVLVR